MLPRANRLKRIKDFQVVLKMGKGRKEDFLILKYLKNKLSINRVGFIVSQKVAKKATQRNKIKRRLREVVRKNLNRLTPGYDMIFIAQKGSEEKKFSELEEKVEQLLKKTKILKND